MAKGKVKKGTSGGAQSHLRARLEYLHNVAAYLQNAATSAKEKDRIVARNIEEQNNNSISNSAHTVPQIITPSDASERDRSVVDHKPAGTHLSNLSRQYISHMRGVSLKTQLRLPIEVKRSFCKRCDIILTPGINCVHEIQNASKGRKKPWADVLVLRCTTCGTEKRFPQKQKRSKKLSERQKEREQRNEQKEKEHKEQAVLP